MDGLTLNTLYNMTQNVQLSPIPNYTVKLSRHIRNTVKPNDIQAWHDQTDWYLQTMNSRVEWKNVQCWIDEADKMSFVMYNMT